MIESLGAFVLCTLSHVTHASHSSDKLLVTSKRQASKMAEIGQISRNWPKMAAIGQIGQTWPKQPKLAKKAKIGNKKRPKLAITVKIGQNGRNWPKQSKLAKNGIAWPKWHRLAKKAKIDKQWLRFAKTSASSRGPEGLSTSSQRINGQGLPGWAPPL